MSRHQSEFVGAIMAVRAVEDSIRATQKYTEGVTTLKVQHPIQGDDFPSKKFCKYYEVYPNVDVSNMSFSTMLEWLTGYTHCVDVKFNYDYRVNKASVIIQDGHDAVSELTRSIPEFGKRLELVTQNHNGTQ